MGIRIEPPVLGNNCLPCWDAGETPGFVYIIFLGVKKGDVPGAQQPPNGEYFKCPQNPLSACEFVCNPGGVGWMVRVWRDPGSGRWFVTLAFDLVQHFNAWNAGCPSEHDGWSNLLWSPIWWAGYGGFAYIFWLVAARALVESMNIPTDEGTFMEFFMKDGTDPVYKFCNLKYVINQTILLSP